MHVIKFLLTNCDTYLKLFIIISLAHDAHNPPGFAVQ